ncbi:MAG: AlpA family phage regulatory protein [Pseudomonadota bacterium]
MSAESLATEIERHYRRPEVKKIVGLSDSSIYRLMSEGKFPRPVKMGDRAVAWSATSLREYLDGRESA